MTEEKNLAVSCYYSLQYAVRVCARDDNEYVPRDDINTIRDDIPDIPMMNMLSNYLTLITLK